jgi:peptidoglycan/xylan/chitin deacetylase (PgdA/CDA1 family)
MVTFPKEARMRAVLLLIAMLHLPAAAWPGGARAAVSLAYDDALDSQLDIALPALDKHGLKATFFLQLSSPAIPKRMAAWRAAAKRGHELGNHTLFHQCSGSKPDRPWVESHRDLDKVSAAQMRDQVVLANTMLAAIDGKQRRTFTAPCGDDHPYLKLIDADFAAIKRDGIAADGKTGQELIALVKSAMDRGGLIALTFHGVGGDYLTVTREAHEELLRYLAANRKLVWTDTYLNIATYQQKKEHQ